MSQPTPIPLNAIRTEIIVNNRSSEISAGLEISPGLESAAGATAGFPSTAWGGGDNARACFRETSDHDHIHDFAR